MILRNGATLTRSGGYTSCEHKDWVDESWRGVGHVGYYGPQCVALSRYVLQWTGRISLQRLEKCLCRRHGAEVLRKSREV